MLSTGELEKYLKGKIYDKINVVTWDCVFFDIGTDNSIEGTYIFSDNKAYHVMFVEKGKIRSDIITKDKEEVLWEVLGIVSYPVILDYSIKNYKGKQDFRRIYFVKELELYSLFGEEFEKKKREEIKKILEKNPYIDNNRS